MPPKDHRCRYAALSLIVVELGIERVRHAVHPEKRLSAARCRALKHTSFTAATFCAHGVGQVVHSSSTSWCRVASYMERARGQRPSQSTLR